MAKLKYVIENLPFIIIKWVIVEPFLWGFNMGSGKEDSWRIY